MTGAGCRPDVSCCYPAGPPQAQAQADFAGVAERDGADFTARVDDDEGGYATKPYWRKISRFRISQCRPAVITLAHGFGHRAGGPDCMATVITGQSAARLATLPAVVRQMPHHSDQK